MINDHKFEVIKRDTFIFDIQIYDVGTGGWMQLAGKTVYFTVKSSLTDEDTAAVIGPITGTVTGETTGSVRFTLSKTETDIPQGQYYYDVQVFDATTTNTVLGPSNNFFIYNDVTESTS